ncbi:MAG TPA: hypothetical protein VJ866_24920 [Pyrinomonadaceae bacterium]|nr:hypothetical protein [Pyrinomonadaceae bacterium]
MKKSSVLLRLRLTRLCAALLLTCGCASFVAVRAQNPCSPSPPTSAPLAAETFTVAADAEVELEVEARSPGANWGREGAEAAALTVLVDGAYSQDLLLWAGDDFYKYRVALGRLSKGRHKVTAALNAERSAAGARRAEVKALRPLVHESARDAASDEELFALAHSPVLYARANTIDHFTDIPLLMYYEILHTTPGETVYRYTVVFTNEDGGTQTAALFARWGRGTDIEWVYEVRARAGKIIEETFQGVRHETKHFRGQRTGGEHPLLADASDNNNFTDLACTAVRFAPSPVRARLEAATRESVMDSFPQTYRAMTEELKREGRISETPSDINTVADPREYLYIEAASTQEGAAVAFDVKLKGRTETFSSDMGEPRLRIERSGYFRTAVRLPKTVAPEAVESVTARCHSHPAGASGGTCKQLKLVRVLTLGPDFGPRVLFRREQAEASLAAGESKLFRLD